MRDLIDLISETFLEEKAIPDSHYGYWVTTDGEILSVPFQSHNVVAHEHGFQGVAEALHRGWVAVHYPGYGPFSLNYGYLTSKAANSVRTLLKIAEQSGCGRYVVEGPCGQVYGSAAEVSRGLASTVKAWTQITKERLAKGLPARRDYQVDDY